jgi:hypothetical protein
MHPQILRFFSKIDWAHPSTYLGILGALGAPAVIWKALKLLGQVLYPLWLRVSQRGLVRDFFYNSWDIGYRIPSAGERYLYIRKESITSCKKGLLEIPLQYRWTCEGDFQEDVTPAPYSLQDVPRDTGQVALAISEDSAGRTL